jgi:hypothetical protein
MIRRCKRAEHKAQGHERPRRTVYCEALLRESFRIRKHRRRHGCLCARRCRDRAEEKRSTSRAMGDIRAYGGIERLRESENTPAVSREDMYLNRERILSSCVLLLVLRKQIGTRVREQGDGRTRDPVITFDVKPQDNRRLPVQAWTRSQPSSNLEPNRNRRLHSSVRLPVPLPCLRHLRISATFPTQSSAHSPYPSPY